MPVNLSIKNVPDELAERLRKRAARAHRSLQGELLAILEEVLASNDRLTPADVVERVREMKLATEADAADIVRTDRDRR